MEWWKSSHTQSQTAPARAIQRTAKKTKADCAQSTLLAFVGKPETKDAENALEKLINSDTSIGIADDCKAVHNGQMSVDLIERTSDATCAVSQGIPPTPSPSKIDGSHSNELTSSSVSAPSSPLQHVEPSRRSARLKNMQSQPALNEDCSSDDDFQPRKTKTSVSKGRLFFMTREEKEKLKAEEEKRLKEEEEERQREREKQFCEKLRDEIKRAKEENLERSQGRQTNPFLLPRAVGVNQTPIVIDGDEEGPKSYCVQWEDDRDGTLWPLPIVPHVTQLHAADRVEQMTWELLHCDFMHDYSPEVGCCEEPNLTSYYEARFPQTLPANQPEALRQDHDDASLACSTTCQTAEIERLAEVSGWELADIMELEKKLKLRRSTEDLRKQLVDMYRPRSSREVCGNQKQVETLRKWLLGHYSDVGSKRSKTAGRTYRSDTDDDDDDDDADECQAILLVGPNGSGKTAAVYALAEELQLQVLEINSSDKRCGKMVLDRVGEATRSQSLSKRIAAESTVISDSPILADKSIDQSKVEPKRPLKNSKRLKEQEAMDEISNGMGPKALILFEEVDVLSDHDKGFLGALTALVAQTCVPIILTCECVPSSLQGLCLRELRWKRPDRSASLVHLSLIAALEQLRMSVEECMMLYKFCSGDLRQALMLLQLAAFDPTASHSTASCLPQTRPCQQHEGADHFLGRDISGVELYSRQGSSGSCQHLECPPDFLGQLFDVGWTLTQVAQEENADMRLKRKQELDVILAVANHADNLSLASSLLQAQRSNEESGMSFAGGSMHGTIASILAASMHEQLKGGNATWLVPCQESSRAPGVEAQATCLGEVIHPAALGVARRAAVMRDYVPWVRDMCVAEQRRAAETSSRRRRAQVHLGGLSEALVSSLIKTSFDK